MKSKIIKLLSLLFVVLSLTSCGKSVKANSSIAVFVPGIMADSPIYDMLAKGVQDAVDLYNENLPQSSNKTEVFILEAGTNQAEWGSKLLSLAAAGKYDVIISSNPSLPDLVKPILEQFPNQKFILLDASCEGNENIYTVCYNQYEQAYLTGKIAGLMSKNHKVALVAAQEYPVMNNVIFPSFELGAGENTKTEFRVVGNWFDANKSAAISEALIAEGVDVLLPICGGAAQGVISSAVNAGAYVTWFDDNGFERAPGTVISSTAMKQRDMSAIVTKAYLEGKTLWGKAEMFGVKEGFIEFVQDDPNYINTVPESVRNEMNETVNMIKEGSLVINEKGLEIK